MDYDGSFTGGGLLLDEFEAIIPFLQYPDWENLLLTEQKQNNILKINSELARKRILTEIRKRIRLVNLDFWQNWSGHSKQEKGLLLFFLCLKTYRLVYDFHFEVTVPRVLSLDMEVDIRQYQRRLEEIASKDEKVGQWTEQTRKKLISTFLTMTKRSGLLVNNRFVKPDVSPSFFCYFIQSRDAWALDAFFLKAYEKESVTKLCL